MKKDELTAEILTGLDADCIGILSYEQWQETGDAATIEKLLPGARSIILMAQEIPAETTRHITSRAEVGAITMRDIFSQTAGLVDGRLDWEGYKLVKKLHRLGYRGLSIPSGGPYDPRFLAGALSYKHIGQAAGVGKIGWNGLLLTPEFGPRVRMTVVLTDAELHMEQLETSELPCLKCKGACVKICPSRAISYPDKGQTFNMDSHRCNSYLAGVQTCAECIRVCPAGKSPTAA